MSDLERRVRQDFEGITVPEQVKHQALNAIEAARPAAATSVAHPSPAHPARVRPLRFKKFAAIAACIVLAALCLSGYRLYATPTAYVGLDINPSVELSLNRFDIVVASQPLNDEGRTLLESVALENKGYSEALALLIESDAFASYAKDDAFLEVSVTSQNNQQAETLREQSDASLAARPYRSACVVVDEQTRAQAAAHGMGVGRYRAALELMACDPAMTLEKCAPMSMRQLRDRIEACAGTSGNADERTGAEGPGPAGGQGNGQHDGQGNGQHDGQGSGQGVGRQGGYGAGNGSEKGEAKPRN